MAKKTAKPTLSFQNTRVFHPLLSSNSQEDPFVRKQVAKVQWALRALSSRVWLLTRQLRAFFRWAEMMDVVICRPFFRCKHHNHDFFETYIWYYSACLNGAVSNLPILKAKTILWAIDEFLPPCSHTLREVQGRVVAVFAWFVIYFSEEQRWVGSHTLLGLDVELPDFWRYWRGGAEFYFAKQRTDDMTWDTETQSPLSWSLVTQELAVCFLEPTLGKA